MMATQEGSNILLLLVVRAERKFIGNVFSLWKEGKSINGKIESRKSINPLRSPKGKFNRVIDYKQIRQIGLQNHLLTFMKGWSFKIFEAEKIDDAEFTQLPTKWKNAQQGLRWVKEIAVHISRFFFVRFLCQNVFCKVSFIMSLKNICISPIQLIPMQICLSHDFRLPHKLGVTNSKYFMNVL